MSRSRLVGQGDVEFRGIEPEAESGDEYNLQEGRCPRKLSFSQLSSEATFFLFFVNCSLKLPGDPFNASKSVGTVILL